MLELKKLAIGYKSQPIISKKINISINKTGFVGVIGKNGSGKSTLLKTIAGILSPIDGDVLFQGQNIAPLPAEKKARIFSFVFANLPNHLPLNVSEILTLNPNHFKLDIDNAIKLFDIEPLLAKNFNSLSDGQKQRVILAKAFAQNTPVLLLDEPETHLDISQNLKIFQTLKYISQQKLVICASHDLNNILKFSDYIWLVSKKSISSHKTESLIQNKTIQKHFGIAEDFMLNCL